MKTFVLDAFVGKQGRKVDVSDTVERWESFRDGWQIPNFGRHRVAELLELKETGEANGVKVSGSTYEAIKVSDAIRLERANRLILKAHQTKSLKDYRRQKARPSYDLRLPDIDVDELVDAQNLKLVKIDLPEEGWYQLTLE
jgi:NMD protein affecting ribosome stability and mRNA decay